MRDLSAELVEIEAKIKRVKEVADAEIVRLRTRKQAIVDALRVLTPEVLETLRKIDFNKET
jgi:hypothetical protein